MSAVKSRWKVATSRVVAAGLVLLVPVAAHAGLQESLQRAILTGVLQGMQSVRLPSSPQSVGYRFDANVDTFVRSTEPGPTVLRTPSTLVAGSWSARLATSYFRLDGTFGPTPYSKTEGNDVGLVTELGSSFSANITMIELAASYGVTDHLELSIDVPISIVDLDARFRWLYQNGDPTFLPRFDASLAGLEQRIQNGELRLASRTPSQASQYLGPARSQNGTQAGLGQIALGAKYSLLRSDRLQIAPSYELLLPSPNEGEFAGPGDVGMTARVLSSVALASWATGYADAGYTYQIDFPELTGFVWDAGFSFNPVERVSFDLGADGTVFSRGIQPIPPETGSGTEVLTAGSAPRLGTNAVNFLFGCKVLLTDTLIASGGVVVPVTSDGIRPAAAGTLALEAYF